MIKEVVSYVKYTSKARRMGLHNEAVKQRNRSMVKNKRKKHAVKPRKETLKL